MSTARILVRSLFANWLGLIANIAVMFFLSPFVVNTLGPVEYGIWSLVNLLTGYMGVLDLGIRASTGRYVVLYIGKEDHVKVDQTIRTALGFFSLTGILMIVAGLGLGWVFPKVISSVPLEYHGMVKMLLPLMAANMWISVVRVIHSSVLLAHDRFDLARIIDLTMLAIRAVGTIVALNMGYGIIGLAMVIIASNLIGLLCTVAVSRKVYPRLRSWPLMLSKERMAELFSYGVFAFISAIAIQIIGQTDLVIVGWRFDLEAVTIYSVGAMLLYYSSTFVNIIATTFFPPVQRAVARGEMGSAKWLFFRQVRLALIVGLPMFVGYIVFGESFIRLWMVGDKFLETSVAPAAQVMAVLAFSNILLLFRSGATSLLNAMGHVRFTAGLTVVQAVLNLSLSLLFVIVLEWGLAGVAAGTLVARALTSSIVLPIFVCKKIGASLGRFLTETVGRGLLCGGVFAGTCLLIQRLIPGDSWVIFWVQVCLAVLFYVPFAAIILVPVEDRIRAFSKIKQVCGQVF
jgi:O-antigen/teichoic acid export membrane protein